MTYSLYFLCKKIKRKKNQQEKLKIVEMKMRNDRMENTKVIIYHPNIARYPHRRYCGFAFVCIRIVNWEMWFYGVAVGLVSII